VPRVGFKLFGFLVDDVDELADTLEDENNFLGLFLQGWI
jgi:hypothetical protein